MAYLAAYEQNKPKLVNALPMDRLMPYLYPHGLMRDNQLAQDVSAAPTDAKKTSTFLEWMEPGITIGMTDTFEKFLKAMDDFVEQTNDATVIFLLKEIRQYLPSEPEPSKPPKPVFDLAAAVKTVTSEYTNLTSLDIGSILNDLFTKEVVNFDQKRKIKDQNRKGMEWFLDNVIISSLNQGVSTLYKGFIEVMENHDDVVFKKKAKDLGGSESIPLTQLD